MTEVFLLFLCVVHILWCIIYIFLALTNPKMSKKYTLLFDRWGVLTPDDSLAVAKHLSKKYTIDYE
jgi:hypothetical protein